MFTYLRTTFIKSFRTELCTLVIDNYLYIFKYEFKYIFSVCKLKVNICTRRSSTVHPSQPIWL